MSFDITLMGDSVLDNFYWLEDKSKDLKYELEQLNYKVNNLAVDESQLKNLFSIKPNQQYISTRHYPYPVNSNGVVNPIVLLRNGKTKTVVLSVGGNDLRVNIFKLALGPENFINSVLTEEFYTLFDKTINEIKQHCQKLILVLFYPPYLGKGSAYIQYVHFQNQITNKLLSFYRTLAMKHNIPLLDLSRTFNSQDRSHYGSTEIEPSNKSNIAIAYCIDYIVSNFNGYATYYAPNLTISDMKVDSSKYSPYSFGINQCPTQ